MIDDYSLEKKEILKGGFTIIVPKEIIEMSDTIAQIKYPAQNRPPIILTNAAATVDYKFTYIDESVDIMALEQLIREAKTNLKRVFTGIEYCCTPLSLTYN